MKKNKALYRVVLFIVGAGLLTRLWGIWQGGFAFTYDTGRDLLAVRDLVYGGKVSLIGPTSGQMGVFYGPWYYWVLAVPFLISGGNPTVIVSFIAVMGVVASALAFWWGRRFFGTLFAIIFSAILAISPVFVGSTNQLWSPHLIVPVMVGIIVVWSKIGTIGPIGLIGLGFLVGFLDELEIVYGVVFTTGFFLALLLWQRRTLISKRGIWLIAGVLITELPRVFFELRHGWVQTKALFALVGTSAVAWNRLRPFFVWNQVTAILPEGAGWVRIVLVGVIVVLVVLEMGKRGKMDKKKHIFVVELATVFGLFIFFVLFFRRDVWPYYLIGLPIISTFFVAVAFSHLSSRLTPAMNAAILLMFLFFVAKPFVFVESVTNPPFVGDAAVYRNQTEVIAYLYDQAGNRDFNYIAYTPPQIAYVWRYHLWRARRQRGWGQTETKQETMFVIIEPDPAYPKRLTEWLNLRKNDGVVQKKVMFPSGIVVETRKRDIDI